MKGPLQNTANKGTIPEMALKNLVLQQHRLIETIHETARMGAKGVWGPHPTQTGVCRLALSDLDKQIRDWFVAQTKELGCSVKVDQVGSIFAVYPGKNSSAAPTAIGSHLDTQPTGGRYDGILGVLAGLEVLRTIKENNYVPNYPIALINWTNEEGARFPMSIMASSVWSQQVQKEDIHKLMSITDHEPVSVKAELERIGYLGSTPASHKENPIAAHFELHIEQGPILEREKKEIGVVVGGQAYSWYTATVKGKALHTGTTPFYARSDALLAASQMMVRGNEIAKKHGGLFSVGVLTLGPGVINVIPELVEFKVDIRHAEDTKLRAIYEGIEAEFNQIAEKLGSLLSVDLDLIYASPAIKFHDKCISCVEGAATGLFGEEGVKRMISGAGHDSCATSLRVPTSMIFIPSRDGVSHHPAEYSTPEQVFDGFRVLLEAVLQYDEQRTE